MKKIILAASLLLTPIIAIAQTITPPMPPMVGGDVDAHGCKPSTGASWSVTLKKCVRIWEVGQRLKPMYKNGNEPNSIVIFNGKNQAIEFFGNNEGNVVLLLNGKNRWLAKGQKYIAKTSNFREKQDAYLLEGINFFAKPDYSKMRVLKIWKLNGKKQPEPIGQTAILQY
jgi:hypothetical protein